MELISVCTDHTQNLIKSFNPDHPISAQNITNTYFEWIGCFSHLINLGICDLFETPDILSKKVKALRVKHL